MKTYIALLKGINVGGHKKVPMADLRELFKKEEFKNVQTYIQSGNVIFQSILTDISEIENKIQNAIMEYFGFEVSVLVTTQQDLQRIFEASPFPEEKKKASYFFMLRDAPHDDLIKVTSEKVYDGEEYKIINDCIYYFYDKGLGQAKFNVNFFERQLKTFATARNYNTMVKLLSLSAQQ